MSECLINGEESTCISITDRGLQYGDGLFETIAVIDGEPRLFSRHLTRLQNGLQRLNIDGLDTARLESEVRYLTQTVDYGVLKIVISRGSGGRGYRAPEQPTPSRILTMHAWPDYPADFWRNGIEARFCRTPMHEHPLLAGLKHLNRLPQVMARSEWQDMSVPEGIMGDLRGNLVEGTQSNLLLVAGETLFLPERPTQAVHGVMQDYLLDYAESCGLQIKYGEVSRDLADNADEILLTNSLIGLWSVRKLQDRFYRPGRVSAMLAEAPEAALLIEANCR